MNTYYPSDRYYLAADIIARQVAALKLEQEALDCV